MTLKQPTETGQRSGPDRFGRAEPRRVGLGGGPAIRIESPLARTSRWSTRPSWNPPNSKTVDGRAFPDRDALGPGHGDAMIRIGPRGGRQLSSPARVVLALAALASGHALVGCQFLGSEPPHTLSGLTGQPLPLLDELPPTQVYPTQLESPVASLGPESPAPPTPPSWTEVALSGPVTSNRMAGPSVPDVSASLNEPIDPLIPEDDPGYRLLRNYQETAIRRSPEWQQTVADLAEAQKDYQAMQARGDGPSVETLMQHVQSARFDRNGGAMLNTLIASLRISLAQMRVQQIQAQIHETITRLYFDQLEAEQLAEAIVENAEIAGDLAEIARTSIDAQGPRVLDITLAEQANLILQRDRLEAQRRITSAQVQLAERLGRSRDAEVEVRGLDLSKMALPEDGFEPPDVESRLNELAGLRTQFRDLQRQIAASASQRRPRFLPLLGGEPELDPQMLTNASDVLGQTIQMMGGAQIRSRFEELTDLAIGAQAAQAKAGLLADALVPATREALNLALAQYRSGDVGFVAIDRLRRDILQFQRELIEAESTISRTLVRLGQGADAPPF